jgi:Sensors of blue-light using FAD
MKPPVKLYEVLYISSLAADAPISVVADIASKARPANQRLGLTGLLLFDGARFCGQLEGQQRDVLAKLDRIEQDPRHRQVEVLHYGPLAERRFNRFSTGYPLLEDDDVLGRIETLYGQAAMGAFLDLLATADLDS